MITMNATMKDMFENLKKWDPKTRKLCLGLAFMVVLAGTIGLLSVYGAGCALVVYSALLTTTIHKIL